MSECELGDSGVFEYIEVNYCPSCGSDVEDVETPTAWKCTQSGEWFFIE